MSFIYPHFLWALFFLAIPILIHFFSFQRHKKLYFSSILFLKKLEKENRSIKKLKHLLILFLRLCAIACLVLAFARPFLSDNKKANGKETGAVLFYIDNSFSMTAKDSDGELLSEAIESARKTIKELPINTQIIIHTNKINGIEARSLNQKEALNQLDKIKPYQLSRSLDEIISWEQKVLDKELKDKTAQIIHYSDFQTKNILSKENKKSNKHLYFPVQFVPQNKSNICVDSVWFDSPLTKPNENTGLKIRIKNNGKKKREGVFMKITINKLKRTLRVDVPANKSVITKINYREEPPGYRKGKIEISDNQLFWDDEYYFSYEIKKQTKILIVNAQDASELVSKVYNLESLYNTREVLQPSFSQDLLKQTDFVILNGVNKISSAMSTILEGFVENGGTLCLLPGAQINRSEINKFLQKMEMPALGRVIESGNKIKEIEYKSPFFNGIFDREEKNIILPGIKKVYETESKTNLKAHNLIKLQNGLPLFCRSYSDKQVFLYTSSLSSSFGSFILDALFPSILLRMGELSQRKQPLYLTIGKQRSYPVYKSVNNLTPIHLKKEKTDIIPQRANSSQGLLSNIVLGGENTDQLSAGIYDIVNKNQKIGQLALNYNTEESQTSYASKKEIMDYFKSKKLEVSEYKKYTGQSILINSQQGKELWKWFVVLAISFFLLELLTLKFWRE